MNIEVLHISDCPNSQAAMRLLEEVLREWASPARVETILVKDSAQAEALAFAGSPTILIDGKDVDPALPPPVNRGLSCRTYLVEGRLQGIPSREMMREAIRGAAMRARTESREG
jgi:hypothetical protein